MRTRIALTVIFTLAISALVPTVAQAAEPGQATTANALLADLPRSPAVVVGYDRDLFEHWVDADGNGCDTRQEILISESQIPVTFGAGCSVISGQWYSWFDGATWTSPGDVDIDHFVPLSEAWQSGAHTWTADVRRSFANDLAYAPALVAVTDNVNQSKSDRDPAGWMPPLADQATQCRYVTEWVEVKYRWQLAVDDAEWTRLQQLLAVDDCGAVPVVAPDLAVTPTPTASLMRYSGATRYDVAVNIAKEYEPGVSVLYIAKGTDFPDALSAAPAAAFEGGPLLLTPSTSLLPAVRAEIARLQPDRIVVVGGEASITPAVFAELTALSLDVVRIGGADRFAVSRNLNKYAFEADGATRVYLATGLNFPDALSASAAAGAIGGAVLLVNGLQSTLDEATKATIRSLRPKDAVIAGGPASVSLGIEQAVSALTLSEGSRRLGGTDRFEAGRNINRDVFGAADQVFLATGFNFPDALAGAALAGRNSAPLYITRGTCVPFNVTSDIEGFGSPQINILGGPASMSPATEQLLPCASNPTVSVTNSCSSGIDYTVTNPNPFAIQVDVGIDYNRDGSVDAGDTLDLAPGAAEAQNLGLPQEDTTVDVIVKFRGSTTSRTTIRVDCVRPPPPVVTPPASVYYANCDAVRAAGKAPLYRGQPGYEAPRLDRDRDGVACE